jgi:hypothetical protein
MRTFLRFRSRCKRRTALVGQISTLLFPAGLFKGLAMFIKADEGYHGARLNAVTGVLATG